ncbi:hypothetical protein [Butyrivibrio sp. WCE2006]|uniref:hypothetical protein n=1 Tax=Butyrivibrio sp. WCE2006 TaxID=1410611 RepID=UPI0005D29D9D|nr:hypothetical protein [Butyrivibrio sp. WCE2006]
MDELEIAMNFEKMTKDEDPEVIVSIIRSIVERIIVTQEGKDSNVHLFLKGQQGENYDDFFADSDTLIDAEYRSDELCDSEGCRKLHPTYAGIQLRNACAEIMEKQGYEEPTGQAKITPGFNLWSRRR